jgi:hypothetical protein
MSVMKTGAFEQEYRRISFAVTVGSFFDQWMVVWGCWDKQHLFYLVPVERRDLSAPA